MTPNAFADAKLAEFELRLGRVVKKLQRDIAAKVSAGLGTSGGKVLFDPENVRYGTAVYTELLTALRDSG